MFHRNGFLWLATVAPQATKKCPTPTPTQRGNRAPNKIKPLKRPEPSGYEPEPSGYEPEPSGYELAPTCFIVMVFMARDRRAQATTPRPAQRGNGAPDTKTIENSVFLHPGGFEPRTKKKYDLQYSRTSSEDVYEYYRPNHSKNLYSNTRREDVKQYCKSQRLRNGSPPPHPLGT